MKTYQAGTNPKSAFVRDRIPGRKIDKVEGGCPPAAFSVAGTGGAAFDGVMEAILRILAVDNEPSVTLSLRYVFDAPRYEIVTVDDGDAALARLEADPDPFDVIIVDQKMPHLTGIELVKAIRERDIAGKIIVVSAHLSSDVCEAYERLNVHVMFGKPFDIDMLRLAVDRLVA